MSSEIYPYFAGNDTYEPVYPIVSKVGDFTPFYIAIAICTAILGSIIILNIVCCCSRYSEYWLDRHTGNRWIVSIWSTTPHLQPPLDYTELKHPDQIVIAYPSHKTHSQSEVPPSISRQALTTSQEYLELHKRESDI